MPFFHKMKEKCILRSWSKFSLWGLYERLSYTRLAISNRDQRRMISITDSLFCRYNFNGTLQPRPKSKLLIALIFNFRSDLLIHWHFFSLSRESKKKVGVQVPPAIKTLLPRPAPHLKCYAYISKRYQHRTNQVPFMTIESSFHSLFRVLFTFPSQYLVCYRYRPGI